MAAHKHVFTLERLSPVLMKGNYSEGGKNEFVMLMDQFLLVKMKWKTFLEAAGADCCQNDGLTGPLVPSSMKSLEEEEKTMRIKSLNFPPPHLYCL